MSGNPPIPPQSDIANDLCFYSYTFFFNASKTGNFLPPHPPRSIEVFPFIHFLVPLQSAPKFGAGRKEKVD